jgi:hypothetical protein
MNKQGQAREMARREIESTDKAIDRLVSPFGGDVRVVQFRHAAGMVYELTEEEIRVVKGG